MAHPPGGPALPTPRHGTPTDGRGGWVTTARQRSASGFLPTDRAARVRRAADADGLDRAGQTELLTILDDRIARGGEWVRAKVEAGHPGFLAMWASIGGQERFDRRRRWWAATRPRFVAALG